MLLQIFPDSDSERILKISFDKVKAFNTDCHFWATLYMLCRLGARILH